MIIDTPIGQAQRLVVRADGGLNLRDAPNGARLTAFFDGSFLTRTGAPAEGSDGFLWVPVQGTDTNDRVVSGFVRIDFVASYDPDLGDMDGTGRINPTLEAAGAAEIKVQPGDSLAKIAQDLGVDPAALIAFNADHIIEPDLIFPGDTIYLPDALPPEPDDGDDRDGPPPNRPDDPVRPGEPNNPDLPVDCDPPAPWDIRGGFTFNSATGRCESSAGARVFVGRTDGYRSLFEMAQGTVFFTNDEIFGDDIRFFADVGGINRSLFVGDIRIDVNSGIGIVTERTSGTFKLGGADVEFTRIEVDRDRLLADVDIQLPGFLGGFGITPSTSLIFGPTGLRFEGQNRFLVPNNVTIPNFIDLPGFNVTTQGLTAEFLTGGRNAFRFQGELGLEIGPVTASLNFRGGKFIQLNSNGSVDVVGQVDVDFSSVSFLQLKGGFGLRQLSGVIDTIEREFGFIAVIDLPKIGTVGAEIGLFNAPGGRLQFNKIGFELQNFNKPIPFLNPWFFQDVDVDLENFARSNPQPLTWTVSGRVTLGPEINPGTSVAELILRDTSFAFDGGFPTISGSVQANLLPISDESFATFNGRFGPGDNGGFKVTGQITSIESILTGNGSLTFDSDGNALGIASIQAQLPSAALDLVARAPGGSFIAKAVGALGRVNADGVFQFINDDLDSNDFVAFSVGISALFLDFDVTFKFTRGDELFGFIDFDFLPNTSALDLIGSWDVPDSVEWVQFTAEWEIPSNAARLQVILPDGSVIDEADFAANGIVLVEDFSGETFRSVAIEAPSAGIYDIELIDESGLGEVRYFAQTPAVGPSFTFDEVTNNADGTVTINYTSIDPDSDAELSFWYDDDLTEFDGNFIGTAIEADGPGTITWDAATALPGDYFLYAVANDGSGPILIEPFDDFSISAGTMIDLTVTITGAEIVGPGEELPVSLLATNIAGDTARNATLVLGLSDALLLPDLLPSGAVVDGTELLIPLGDLAPGEMVALDLVFGTASETTEREIGITASLTSDTPTIEFLSSSSVLIVPFPSDGTPNPEPVLKATISGKYFVDANDNGVDDSEPGVAGVEVSLVAASDPDGVIETTVTGASGFYRFEDVDDGIYTVRFNDQVSGRALIAPDQGSNDTRDSDAVDLGNGRSEIAGITVLDGLSVPDNDAGVRGSSISGRVFLDTDRDGRGAEPGIGGIIVELLDADGNVVGAPAITSTVDGSYVFRDLTAGRYTLRFNDNAERGVLGIPDIGPDDADSDAVLTDTTGVYIIRDVEIGLAGSSTDNDLGLLDPSAFDTILFGTDDRDRLFAKNGPALFHSEGGNDKIWASNKDDMISAGAGHDYISSRRGDDIVNSGSGDDWVNLGRGDDVLVSGPGDDRVYGGRGDDHLDTGLGNDRIYGGRGSDSIDAGAGHDRVKAGRGRDTVDGGEGNDYIVGESGDDVLNGGAGRDYIFGSWGDDMIAGGSDNDRLYGGQGRDVFVFKPGDGEDQIGDFSRYDRSQGDTYSHRWWGREHHFSERGDKIDLQAFEFESFEALRPLIRSDGWYHTRIDFGEGDALRIDVRSYKLSEDDFII